MFLGGGPQLLSTEFIHSATERYRLHTIPSGSVSIYCYSFSDISLSVCLFMCMYLMLVALSMCLRVGAGIV